MVRQNRLTGDFDLVAGASNSIRRSMLPLAERIAARINSPSRQLYYGLAKELEPGVTGRLQLVIEDKKIIRFFYDEIFADTPEEIKDPELAPITGSPNITVRIMFPQAAPALTPCRIFWRSPCFAARIFLALLGFPTPKGRTVLRTGIVICSLPGRFRKKCARTASIKNTPAEKCKSRDKHGK